MLSALSPLFTSLLTSVLLGSLRGGFLEPVPFHFPSRLQQGRSISLGERQEEEPKPSNFQKTYLKLIFWQFCPSIKLAEITECVQKPSQGHAICPPRFDSEVQYSCKSPFLPQHAQWYHRLCNLHVCCWGGLLNNVLSEQELHGELIQYSE